MFTLFLQNFLSRPLSFFTPRALLKPENIKLSSGALRFGNSTLAAKICLEYPVRPSLLEKGVTQWWG